MKNIDALLAEGEPEENLQKKQDFGLNELLISRYAYEKAFRYAHLVMKGRWGSLEIGGFLTVPKDSQDRIARDAFLARDQEVGSAEYRVDAKDVSKAGKELKEKGQRIIGWWHSHGKIFSPHFHSDTDAKNQMVLLNQISPSNYISLQKEKSYDGLQSRVEGDNLVFWDVKTPSIRFNLQLRGENPELAAERLRILEEKKIGFAYSFVVNENRWLRKRVPYCEIATRDLCTDCMHAEDASSQVGCKVFDYGEYKLEDEQLLAEIKERVHVFGESKGNKKYFLPSVFEQQRAAGTLKKPDFGTVTYQVFGGGFLGKKGGGLFGAGVPDDGEGDGK